MVLRLGFLCRIVVILLSLEALALADTAAFDLPGPQVEVRVTRGGKQLPISQVPNLQEGDRLASLDPRKEFWSFSMRAVTPARRAPQ